jgi:hypothetical protein
MGKIICWSMLTWVTLPRVWDRRTWTAPEPSVEAFAANRDPGLEAIFSYHNASDNAQPTTNNPAKKPAEKPHRFTAPPGKETEETKRLIDQAQAELKSGKSASDVLIDPVFMAVHPWPRFRKLISEFARSPEARIVAANEPGIRLVVTGRVVDAKGQPLAGARVYVYQTSSKGWYSDRAAHVSAHEGDRKHARLFGYLRTDEEGTFKLRTIRPGGYADSNLPAHIHVEVERPESQGGGLVTEIQFDDDPRLTADWRRRSQQEKFVIAEVQKGPDGSQRVQVELRTER